MFGRKLYTLRKEKGLSQEALAEQLNTTRQAISKWENGQGHPETEKLLMMGNIFEVSIDYLLKESEQSFQRNVQGFYVSKEMAEEYLMKRDKIGKYLAAGFFMLAISFIPYFFFEYNPEKYIIPTLLMVIIGLSIIVLSYTFEEDKYKILSREPLLFDEYYLQTLKKQYKHVKKKCTFFMSFGLIVFIAGFLPLIFEEKNLTFNFFVPYYPLCIFLIATGVYILTRNGITLEAYKLLANNEEHVNRTLFKLKRKVRKKLDDL